MVDEVTFRQGFGLRLKVLRERAGITQTDLSIAVSDVVGTTISQNRISNWEIGLGLPSIAFIPAICRIIHCTANELLGTAEIKLEEDELNCLRIYRELDEDGKHMINVTLEAQLKRVRG